jgi:hypothetical protein
VLRVVGLRQAQRRAGAAADAVVIDTALGDVPTGGLLGARVADVRVYWSDSGDAPIAALAIVA